MPGWQVVSWTLVISSLTVPVGMLAMANAAEQTPTGAWAAVHRDRLDVPGLLRLVPRPL
jgi:hypothetical protein